MRIDEIKEALLKTGAVSVEVHKETVSDDYKEIINKTAKIVNILKDLPVAEVAAILQSTRQILSIKKKDLFRFFP